MLRGIPCVQMRGGTSKGLYFLKNDLPQDDRRLTAVLLAAMGSPDPRQIDGVGGASPLTSKVAIISKSDRPNIDVDYRFAQVVVDKPTVDFNQNCGNILAGVAPFAIDHGLVPIQGAETRVRIHMVNSDQDVVATVQTPDGRVNYEGDYALPGVPGTAAPIRLVFLDTAGSACQALLPTGSPRDIVEGIEVTCIDNGMPCVIMRARDLGITGYESCAELERNLALKERIEAMRLELGPGMNLDDVANKTIPKMVLVSLPRDAGVIHTRSFIPHKCHASIGVLAAVSVATACALPGSVTEGIARVPSGRVITLLVEHPAGATDIELELAVDDSGGFQVLRSSQVRTAQTAGVEKLEGTYPYTLERSHKGFRINDFLHNLTLPAHRAAFLANEEAALAQADLTDEERDLIRRRDWRGLIHYGTTFFVLEKLGAVVGVSNPHIYAAMRGQSLEEFQKTRKVAVQYSVAGGEQAKKISERSKG